MAASSNAYFQTELESRRQRLVSAMDGSAPNDGLTDLLAQVDAALERVQTGTFGLCEVCHETVEADRLRKDPLIRFCLDHLSAEERRALERDLEGAAGIQRSLLPAQDIHAVGWRIHHHYWPAGPVSGDYCDVIQPNDREGALYFLLGDVSGKGMSACMLMAHLHAMFRSLIPQRHPLDQLLASANRLLCESAIGGLYATLVCGRANSDGNIEIGSAGHLPVWLAGCAGVRTISATGMPLGLFSTSTYTTQKFQLDPGQCLFLYTDGLSESRDSNGDEYGEKRLRQFIGSQYQLAPAEFSAACLSDLHAFSDGKPPTDDLTLMVVRREN
ncbi:MAG: SpoIIE family protein phosphatase [Candidatus Acidiferrales bacterium]